MRERFGAGVSVWGEVGRRQKEKMRERWRQTHRTEGDWREGEPDRDKRETK